MDENEEIRKLANLVDNVVTQSKGEIQSATIIIDYVHGSIKIVARTLTIISM